MLGVIAIMLLIAIMEAPAFLRQKKYRDLLFFGLLWALAFIYASLVALKVPLPTVVETLNYIYSLVDP